MSRTIAAVVIFAVVGLVLGYLMFARVADQYVAIGRILNPPGGAIEQLVSSVTGLARMRQNILISGGVGAVLGLVAGLLTRRR